MQEKQIMSDLEVAKAMKDRKFRAWAEDLVKRAEEAAQSEKSASRPVRGSANTLGYGYGSSK